MHVDDEVSQAAKAISALGAQKGGIARAAALTPAQRSASARRAVNARWQKAGKAPQDGPTATHMGELKIGELVIPCAVLGDGTRMITSRGFMTALGRPWRGKYKGDEKPNFLAANNLEQFVDEEVRGLLEPIEYALPQGGKRSGYRAELLPKLCEVYLRARDARVDQPSQKRAIRGADIVMRGLAQVGIIALVDEATGYQDTRAKEALQQILQEFIANELRPWVKTFQDDFYKQIFRLNNWPYTEESIKYRPGVIGHWTNDIVYDRLAPGVRAELQRVVVRDANGRPRHKYHQHLSEDVGHPKLREHIAAVTALMRASRDWSTFCDLLDRALPRYDSTLMLDL